jgi:NitT/TauT family transport system substrate-binding protein
MKRNLSRRTSLAAFGGVFLASAARVVAQPLTHVTIVTSPSDAGGEVYYGAENGTFKKYGLDVEIISLRGGAAVAAAMSSGQYEIGQGNVVSIAAAREKGVPFVLVAPANVYDAKASTSTLIVPKDSPIKSLADLKGKTVANIELRDIGNVALDIMLEKANLPVSTIRVVELPASEMGAALARGTVDSAFIIEPYLSAAMPDNRVLALPYSAIAPRFQIASYFSTADWLRGHADVAGRFRSAIREVARWANGNHALSAAILEKYTKIHVSATQTRATYAEELDPRLLQPILDAAAKDRVLSAPIRPATLFGPP